MNLELHVIQNFAPSNLNRDDLGAPKDCLFGGTRRARISSQCLKRAMRDHFRLHFAVPGRLAVRSARIGERIARMLEADGHAAEQSQAVVVAALAATGFATKADGKLEYLLFLAEGEISALADVCSRHFDEILASTVKGTGGDCGGDESSGSGRENSKRAAKRAAKEALSPAIARELRRALDGGKAVDLALFGRMLADLKTKSREAAAQVAHAISTHRCAPEFDFFTSLDDLRPEAENTSAFLGATAFTSACFYRYANLDVRLLEENLKGDGALTRAAAESFVRAFVDAVPRGMQNSFATRERPSFILAVVRDRSSGFASLANSFERAVTDKEWDDDARRPRSGLLANSIERLAAHWDRLASVYGDDSAARFLVSTIPDLALGDALAGADAGSFEALCRGAMNAIFATPVTEQNEGEEDAA